MGDFIEVFTEEYKNALIAIFEEKLKGESERKMSAESEIKVWTEAIDVLKHVETVQEKERREAPAQ